MEATLSYIGNTFFTKPFILLEETDFVSSGNSVFLIRAIPLLVEAIIGTEGETSFKERVYYCWGTTDFLAIFYLFFSDGFFSPSSENDVSRKSFIPASANGF